MSSTFPVVFFNCALMLMFSTLFGKSGYLKEALFETTLMSIFGMRSALEIPLISPET